MYTEQIRSLLAQHARLLVDANTLGEDSDLYQAGLTSLSTVNLMLALEEHFDVEFLDRMLGRKTFGSMRALNDAIAELKGDAVTPAHGVTPAQAGAQSPHAVTPAQAGAQFPQSASVQP
jgi:acyl carrier protein